MIDKELFSMPKSNEKIFRGKIQYKRIKQKKKREKRLNVCNEST